MHEAKLRGQFFATLVPLTFPRRSGISVGAAGMYCISSTIDSYSIFFFFFTDIEIS
jgi:hypothetical protein